MRGVSIIAFSCSVIFITLLFFIFTFETDEKSVIEPIIEEPLFEPQKNVRDITPEKMLPGPAFDTSPLQRLPAVEPPPPPKRPAQPQVWARTLVKAAGILQSEGKTILLSGISPIELDKKCIDEKGKEWPCGMFARTEMRKFVRGRSISCIPPDEPGPDEFITRCKIGKIDISAWLVFAGWAIPENDLFAEELSEAKKNLRGQWRKQAP